MDDRATPVAAPPEVIELSAPIMVGSTEVKSITLAEPTFGDFVALADLDLGIVMAEDSEKFEIRLGKIFPVIPVIVSRLSGLPLEDVNKIKAVDLTRIGGRIMGFFGDFLQAGKMPQA